MSSKIRKKLRPEHYLQKAPGGAMMLAVTVFEWVLARLNDQRDGDFRARGSVRQFWIDSDGGLQELIS
jgi:hypothetical protein